MSFNYPRNVRFRCLKCAKCCGDTETRVRRILLLKCEAERIAEAMSKPIVEFAQETEGHAPYVYEMKKTQRDGKCVFLKNERCTIYRLRPLICRFYPFELIIVEEGKHEFRFTMECPGMGKGGRLTKKYFEALLRQL
ncbi:MAG: YkgJ family cysteine cluster protein [Candidatus Bathyarchaeia archaeon]